jgi:hypothetical protein
VALVASLCKDAGRPDAEVTRTYHARRFDAAKTVGLKVYVVPLEDDVVSRRRGRTAAGTRSTAGSTSSSPSGCRRPGETWDEKDAWVDELVDLVTTVRDRLADKRDFPSLDGFDVQAGETGTRQVADIAELNQNGVFVSEFTSTIREE